MRNVHLTVEVLVLIVGYASTQDPGCDYYQQVQATATYELYNKNYPNNYTPGVQCRWIFQCPTGYNCAMNCNVNLPSTSSCTMDRLLISKTGDPQLSGAEYYCGQGTLSAVSTGQSLSVGLITSYSSPGGTLYCTVKAQQASNPGTCSCGYKKLNRIVGGQETGVNEFPSMVGIVLDVNSALIKCGGTIISPRYVLTAAHCVRGRNVNIMAVVVGEHDVTVGDSTATKAYKVSSFIIHPQFNPSNYDYDIAIIRVANDIVFGPLVGPVCLPFKFANQDFTNVKLTALGWGTLFVGGSASDVLRKVDLDVISQSQCRSAVPSLTNRQFCTYTPGKDACQDDSGGPLLFTEPSTGLLYNFGIISYGQLCATAGNPGINTRVPEFLTWIQNNTPGENYCRK